MPAGTKNLRIVISRLDRAPNAFFVNAVDREASLIKGCTKRLNRFIEKATGDEAAARYQPVADHSCESLYRKTADVGDDNVEAAVERGLNVMMEIDVQGGVQVAGKMPESIRVFVLPPDQASLRTRLEGRHTEAKEQLSKRLAKADGEIALARDSGCYQHFVVNDDLEATVEEVKRIVEQESGVT